MEKRLSEEEIDRMARSARVICEASDGKVSDFAFELSKEIGRGNITGDEAVALTRKYYKDLKAKG